MLQQLVVAVEVQPCPVVVLSFFCVLQQVVHLLELAVAAYRHKLHILVFRIDAVLEMRQRLNLAHAVGAAHPHKRQVHPLPFHPFQRHHLLVHIGQCKILHCRPRLLSRQAGHYTVGQHFVFRELAPLANHLQHLHHLAPLIVSGQIIGLLQRLQRHQFAHPLIAQQRGRAQRVEKHFHL